MNHLQIKKEWKKFKSSIAPSGLYEEELKIYSPYISKYNTALGKQIILLTIPNLEKQDWHYLAVKKLSALLHEIISNHNGEFYC